MSVYIDYLYKINDIYKDVDGMSISLKGRKDFNYDLLGDLTYGELVVSELVHIFSKMNLSEDMHFVDLGSGTGKITLYASLLFPFRSFTGVEIVSSLHDVALQKYKDFKTYFNLEQKITFLNQSFLDFDFNNKFCFYANSLCFSDETCKKIALSFENTVKGSYFFATKELPLKEDHYEVTCLEDVLVSWGVNLIYIYKKLI